ncbi:nitroreductase/quinone reductase family protein [Mycobacterium sp. ITM-2016-00318]|uniref:nitroreductase/quinone reductase family protein n=1 Tax=Mycobacterium sp. ITM-2016-00318 TaxID=2099693 RepID=UPI000CF8BB46|nr:nitroreductase/quinone reductase family protein [Mycobacterium sp. ITM-2016-00318]WNG91000.1 nitroreductase/quinone reductase family protein [Mycobacterium sp. ITM-2016-00318]
MSSDDTINGIRRVDLQTRGPWRRRLQWWMGGGIAASKPALAILRRVAMPFEPTVMKVTRGRLTLSPTLPVVVLTSVGARSGERRDVPLAYFTDGDDVVLIASNYGGSRHPAWYHNVRAHPECELHIGPRGGRFIAREVHGADRDRLYELAKDRLAGVFALHEKRSGDRTIPVMRLSPA